MIFFNTGLPFPENVVVEGEECGPINVTWEVSVNYIGVEDRGRGHFYS